MSRVTHYFSWTEGRGNLPQSTGHIEAAQTAPTCRKLGCLWPCPLSSEQQKLACDLHCSPDTGIFSHGLQRRVEAPWLLESSTFQEPSPGQAELKHSPPHLRQRPLPSPGWSCTARCLKDWRDHLSASSKHPAISATSTPPPPTSGLFSQHFATRGQIGQ